MRIKLNSSAHQGAREPGSSKQGLVGRQRQENEQEGRDWSGVWAAPGTSRTGAGFPTRLSYGQSNLGRKSSRETGRKPKNVNAEGAHLLLFPQPLPVLNDAPAPSISPPGAHKLHRHAPGPPSELRWPAQARHDSMISHAAPVAPQLQLQLTSLDRKSVV